MTKEITPFKNEEKERREDVEKSQLLNKIKTTERFLMNINNKPEFLVARLEHMRQLFNKFKEAIST